MPTLVHLEGWDHQADPTAATRGGGGLTTQLLNRKLADTTNQEATHTYSTSVVHHAHTDSAALRITNPPNTANWITNLSGTSQHVVAHLAFRYAVLPVGSSSAALVRFMSSAGVGHDIQVRSGTGVMRAAFGGANGADQAAVVVNTWYILEAHVESVGTQHDLVWKVYPAGTPGSPLVTQRTDSGTGLTDDFFTEMRVGGGAATVTTLDLFLDDWLVSETAADYPLGEHFLKTYKPNGKGTHNQLTGTFKNAALTAITNSNPQNAHLDIDDIPGDPATYITQNTNNTAAYLEFTTNASTETAVLPDGLRLMAACVPSATGQNQLDVRLSDTGLGLETATMLFDASVTAAVYEYHCSVFQTRPDGTALTAGSVQGSNIRVGYSNDTSPAPVLAEVFLTVSWPVTTAQGMISAPAGGGGGTFGGTLTGAGGTGTMDGGFLDDGVTYGGTLTAIGSGTSIVVPSLTATNDGTVELLLGVASGDTAFNPDPGWLEKLDIQQNLSSSSADQTLFAAYRVVGVGATNAALGTLDDASSWVGVHLLISPATPPFTVTAPATDISLGGNTGDPYIVRGTVGLAGGTPTITVNGNTVTPDASGNWSYQITLVVGANLVTSIATLLGSSTQILRTITVTRPDDGGTGGSGDPGVLSTDVVRISDIIEESGLDP